MASSVAAEPDTTPASLPDKAPAKRSRHRPPVPPPAPVAGWRERFAAICGRVVLLAAIWSLIRVFLRPVSGLHWVDDILGLVNLPVSGSLFSAVFLLILSGAVRRRMRVASWLLIAFQVLTLIGVVLVVLGLALGQISANDQPETGDWVLFAVNGAFSVVLLILLWLSRPAFASRLARGARWQALTVLVVGLAASVAVSIALTLAVPHTLDSPRQRVIWAARTALGFEPDATEPGWAGHRGPHWIAILGGVLSTIALVAAALVFLRSARAKESLAANDELDIRRLLIEHGERDSLGYFATRRDKSAIFAPDRTAAVTYRVVATVSLVSADPIGAPSAWGPAIAAWLAEARGYGWFPAVLSASEEGANAYVSAGLKALPIGDEAIIETDRFTLEGARMQPVRRAVHRVQRAGYTIRVCRHAELSAAELELMEHCAELWRGDDTERGFSMALGRLGDPSDGACVAVLGYDATGQLRGLLSFVPWGLRGLSLDLMRRDRDAENGLTEAMVAELIATGRDDLGIRRISLNFAMFRGIFSAAERVGAGPFVRLTNRVLTFASRFWQLESLYRSNERYLPTWTPRYLCYDSSLTISRVALASGMAEGFVPGPVPRVTRDPADECVPYKGETVPFAIAVAEQQHDAQRRLRPGQRLTEQQRVRRQKLDRLAAAGKLAYPVAVPRTCDIAATVDRFGALPPDTRTGEHVAVVGRVRALRDFGGLVFLVLQDGSATIQAMAAADSVGTEAQHLLRATVDLGDYISIAGEVVTSRSGELSIYVISWAMASKCLRPLPDLHAGFADPDARVRQRHLDLIMNADSMQTLLNRSAAIRAVRDAFGRRGFVEVETPMLQAVHGGANARPFVTHINAYDTTLYLRIAPELFLKRLCVGGMAKVFELNRNFRNEGADATHNPEFTSVEAYQAHADYLTMRELTRELIVETATAVHGRPIARRPQPNGQMVDVDLSGPWRSMTVHEAISQACNASVSADTGVDELLELCRAHGVTVPAEPTPGLLVAAMYDDLVEKQTIEPTFYLDFPVETSPLTRVHRADPRLSERWDLVAFGMEIGTAYSELIDPIDQRERLTEQSLAAAAGDPEAMQVDEAFLSALEYAMPPTGGLGIGVDRLVMMLTGANIRQTLAFPFVRPGTRTGA